MDVGALPALRRITLAAVVALTALTLVACSDDEDAPLADDPGVSHVHGLGVDPADGTLYAATHHGVFRIPENGRATRVADRYQDTMAFTVVGPRRFLASGHPELDDPNLNVEGKPPLLGLIESTDAGETWTSLSLLGEADFHALAAAHGFVYGFDATGNRLMVSSDGRRWEARSQVLLHSFAVSPSTPDVIVGGTGASTLRSGDGGRTWAPLAGAPPSLWLSWTSGGLWLVTPEGVLHRSDDGFTWSERGRAPGVEPDAFAADGSRLFISTRTGIHESRDGGASWRVRYGSNPRPAAAAGAAGVQMKLQ